LELAWPPSRPTAASIEVQLARIPVPGFLVVSRNSTEPDRGREVAIRQIREELGVDYPVEGSV
jgi:TolB-like protein